MKYAVFLLSLTALSGCLCLPADGEGVDSNYFNSCWDTAKSGPRHQVMFPKS